VGFSLSFSIPRWDEDLMCSPQLSHWYDDDDDDDDDDDVLSASKVDGHSEDMDQVKHDDTTDDSDTDGSDGIVGVMNL
ncbi:Uncharacterized protein LTLLF_158005, partial [Microtus ochrogaster]